MSQHVPRLSRRQALAGAGALLFGSALAGRHVEAQPQPMRPLRGGEILPTPDLRPERIIARVAGVRPYRAGGARLEMEPFGEGRFLIHNYGHGGAGITLSFGSAERVAQMVAALVRHGRIRRDASVAILGSGVCGLTVATRLREQQRRMRLTIYYREPVERTTSFIAGGQFAPAGILRAYQGRLGELRDLVKASHDRVLLYRDRGTAADHGIVIRRNYSFTRHDAFDAGTPCAVVEEPQQGWLPFAGLRNHAGWEYRTHLINPSILLPKLRSALEGNAQFRQVTIQSPAQLQAMDHTLYINCTGLGARALFNDQSLAPVKGQLVLLRNDQQLKYLFSERCGVLGAEATYLFCRQNDIVVGGSYEGGVGDSIPVERDTNRILDRMTRIFRGETQVCFPPGYVPPAGMRCITS